MAKRKKRPPDPNVVIQLVELRAATIAHAGALKAAIRLLEEGNVPAATARLEGAVTALHATIRGQCAGQTMACPACGTEQDVVAWVDDGSCRDCGGPLEVPE